MASLKTVFLCNFWWGTSRTWRRYISWKWGEWPFEPQNASAHMLLTRRVVQTRSRTYCNYISRKKEAHIAGWKSSNCTNSNQIKCIYKTHIGFRMRGWYPPVRHGWLQNSRIFQYINPQNVWAIHRPQRAILQTDSGFNSLFTPETVFAWRIYNEHGIFSLDFKFEKPKRAGFCTI